MQTLPRPRLASSEPLYAAVAALADRLDAGGMDLWAANVRGCLAGERAGERVAALGFELTRLRQAPAARRLGLHDDVDALRRTLATAVGEPDGEDLPLYIALRDLADHLLLAGGRRLLKSLRAVAADPVLAPEERLAQLRALLADLAPGSPDVPVGGTPRIAAVLARLQRVRDAAPAARTAILALRPPA